MNSGARGRVGGERGRGDDIDAVLMYDSLRK